MMLERYIIAFFIPSKWHILENLCVCACMYIFTLVDITFLLEYLSVPLKKLSRGPSNLFYLPFSFPPPLATKFFLQFQNFYHFGKISAIKYIIPLLFCSDLASSDVYGHATLTVSDDLIRAFTSASTLVSLEWTCRSIMFPNSRLSNEPFPSFKD